MTNEPPRRPEVKLRTRRKKVVKKVAATARTAAEPDVAQVPRTAKTAKKKTLVKPKSKPAKKTKAQRLKEQWTGPENIRRQTSGLLKSMMHEAAKEFGDPDICTAGEAGRLVLGVPLPCFALEYLFQNTVLPFGRVMQLAGVEGTCKSGVACEIARWFIVKCGGIAAVKEHESKYSPDWTMSIIGWENEDSFGYVPCDSVDDWQKRQLYFLNKIKKQMQGTSTEPGPGMVYPVLSIVDSIMGKGTKDSQQRIDDNGSAGRDFPIEAQSITKYMRHVPQKIRQWPFFIILVNHEKPQKDPQTQAIIRNKAGGRGKEFQETFEIGMSKIKKIATKDYDGLTLQMRCYKNSLGVTDRKLQVDVRWWDQPLNEDDPKSPWKQHTVFDWHGATIDLLMRMKKSKTPDKGKVNGVIDLVESAGKRVHSERLGISKDDALSYSEAGLVLHENEEVKQDLRRVFGVKTRPAFEPGVDYRRQLGDEKRKIGKKMQLQ